METKRRKEIEKEQPKPHRLPYGPKTDLLKKWDVMSGAEIDAELFKNILGRKVIIKIKNEDWAISGTITFMGEKFFLMEFATKCDWEGTFAQTEKIMEEYVNSNNLEDLEWVLLRKDQIGHMTSYVDFTWNEHIQAKGESQ